MFIFVIFMKIFLKICRNFVHVKEDKEKMQEKIPLTNKNAVFMNSRLEGVVFYFII